MTDNIDAEQTLEAAIAHHTARRLDQAEQLYRAVLRIDPDNLDALNLLGVVRQDLGHTDESLALINRAISIDPAFPEAHANLARGLNAMGQPDKAAIAAQKACDLDPGLGDGWLQLGFAHLALGQDRDAMSVLREAAVLFPDSTEVHVAIAGAAQRLNNPAAAAAAWTSVLRIQPDRVDALVNLGAAYGNMRQLDDALRLHQHAVAVAPDDFSAKAALAVTLHRRRDAAELIPLCLTLLNQDPARADVWALLAAGQTWMGRFDAARESCGKALALRPDHGESLRLLDALATGPISLDEAKRLRTLLDDKDLAPADRINAGFLLGTRLDAAKEHDAAFQAYIAANALVHAELAVRRESFDPAVLHRYIDQVIATFTRETLSRPVPGGNLSEIPVFIVGMPRSSTSLVEQIAASHPLVHGAGEGNDIHDLVGRLNQGTNNRPPDQWDPDQARAETDHYVARTRAKAPGAARVIDKTPDNILYLGQIALLFPQARIIVCRRDPRDVCTSCFTTHFAEGMQWSYDLKECASRAVEIERLMSHWRKVMPGRVLEVIYEHLVADLETESRRLIDILGLDWDPACLDFYKTERQVLTASLFQVRQPLFTSSIGRWRRYEAHLGPMISILERAQAD